MAAAARQPACSPLAESLLLVASDKQPPHFAAQIFIRRVQNTAPRIENNRPTPGQKRALRAHRSPHPSLDPVSFYRFAQGAWHRKSKPRWSRLTRNRDTKSSKIKACHAHAAGIYLAKFSRPEYPPGFWKRHQFLRSKTQKVQAQKNGSTCWLRARPAHR